jgi:amiloride-sensitive sodium channel
MWTMQNGYKSSSSDAYPNRVWDSGVNGALKIYLRRTADESIDNTTESLNGFKVLLHTPGEIPRLTKRYFRVAMKKHFVVNIRPQMISTSKGLDSYEPEKRQCFLYKEKKMRFFKIYTQSNCQLECLTNFTIRNCQCVHFSMPRSNDTSVCESDKWGCTRESQKLFTRKMLEVNLKPKLCRMQEENLVDEFSCDCLPSCTSIEYDTEVSFDDFPYDKINEAMNISTDSK